MAHFRTNPNCRCARCRLRGMMAPAILITLGLIMLLDTTGVRTFHDTWPLLLIVMGIVKVLQYTAPMDGHVDVAMQNPYVTPPPVASGGQYPPQDPNAGNQGVNNG
jgi:Domain of unknown function (DUF5668)